MACNTVLQIFKSSIKDAEGGARNSSEGPIPSPPNSSMGEHQQSPEEWLGYYLPSPSLSDYGLPLRKW